MTLDEAVAAYEKDFVTSDETGFVEEDGRRDMARAPNGDRYVGLVTTGWFTDPGEAAEAWLAEAWRYAERRGGHALFWRQRPVWKSAEFIAIDQAALLNDADLRDAIHLRIGRVFSSLLVSKG